MWTTRSAGPGYVEICRPSRWGGADGLRCVVKVLRDQFPTATKRLPPVALWASTDAEAGMRRCAICREWKPFDAFRPNMTAEERSTYYCKPCRRAYDRGYHEGRGRAA